MKLKNRVWLERGNGNTWKAKCRHCQRILFTTISQRKLRYSWYYNPPLTSEQKETIKEHLATVHKFSRCEKCEQFLHKNSSSHKKSIECNSEARRLPLYQRGLDNDEANLVSGIKDSLNTKLQSLITKRPDVSTETLTHLVESSSKALEHILQNLSIEKHVTKYVNQVGWVVEYWMPEDTHKFLEALELMTKLPNKIDYITKFANATTFEEREIVLATLELEYELLVESK